MTPEEVYILPEGYEDCNGMIVTVIDIQSGGLNGVDRDKYKDWDDCELTIVPK
jgi:hypothetical protein